MIRQLNPQSEKLNIQEKVMLNKVLRNLTYILPHLNENLGHVVPPGEFLVEGMLAYADGTNWDPGSGQGLYRYTGSAWSLIDGVAVSLTSASANLSGDVTLTNANTFYDGPSVSLAAGTWHVTGAVLLQTSNGSPTNITAKLWNGTTVAHSGETMMPATNGLDCINLSDVLTLTGTETWKISAATTGTGATGVILAACPHNGAGNNASYIHAVKIA